MTSTVSPHIHRVSYGHRSGSSQVSVTIIGIAARSFRDVYLKADGRMGEDPLGYAASALVADQAAKLADRQDRAEEDAHQASFKGERKDFAIQTGIALGMLEALMELAATALANGRDVMAPPALVFIERVVQEAGDALAKDAEYAARMAEQERQEQEALDLAAEIRRDAARELPMILSD